MTTEHDAIQQSGQKGELMLLEEYDEIFESRNTLRILATIAEKKRRFGELQRLFGSPATLTLRLRDLERLNLVKREMEIQGDTPSKRSPAVICYEATAKGKKISDAFREFRRTVHKILRIAEP